MSRLLSPIVDDLVASSTAQLIIPRTISKSAQDPRNFRRISAAFDSARLAIAGFFNASGLKLGDRVLCPAYIGLSPKEGSGVLDPLLSLGLRVSFYRVTPDLGIDVENLRDLVASGDISGVIVIPFFGHVPSGYKEAIDLVREAGVLVLEDEAHALLTDLVKGSTGRFGDAAVVSLHKFLPLKNGGGLFLNEDNQRTKTEALERRGPITDISDYDLSHIAQRRIENTEALSTMLAPLSGVIEPLWTENRANEVLHSYPVLLASGSRDDVYELMNGEGIGVVTLYHTLVPLISPMEFPVSHRIANRILNLPIHQDLRTDDLQRMVDRLYHHATRLAS